MRAVFLCLGLLAGVLVAACAGQRTALCDRIPETVIKMKGSDTMLVLVERWAAEFMQRNPGVSIHTEGGGSATGIRALIEGSIDICTASRPMRPEEIRLLVERRGSLGIAIICARDALSLYLNPENPISDLTIDQVRGALTGSVVNWKTLGGLDEPIVVVGRNPNSGTYLFLEEHVLLGEPYSRDALSLPTTAAIVQAVLENRAAIGYGGFSYGGPVVRARISGVAPTPENVRNGTYPIARHLYFYVVEQPRGLVKAFTDWVLSREGQRIAESIGYIPLYEID